MKKSANMIGSTVEWTKEETLIRKGNKVLIVINKTDKEKTK